MSPTLYALTTYLFQILAPVGVGTNLALYQLFFALLSGRFLPSRGALFPALAETGLSDDAVRRSGAALAYGHWKIADLVNAWRQCVRREGRFAPHRQGSFRPVAVDLVGFFRPRLHGQVGKHYTSQADKALPALVFGMVADVGSVGNTRLPLLRALVRQQTHETESALQTRLLQETAATLSADEILIVDAGFGMQELLGHPQSAFLARLDQNVTARRNVLPPYQGSGRHAEYGAVVRPLARTYAGKRLEATPPDKVVRWKAGRHSVRAHVFANLVAKTAKPGAATFRILVIFDPRYSKPLVVSTNRALSAYEAWRLYADRWPVEQMPLAAKQMLGCSRAFVFGSESRWRLPELAMLAGNVLAYVAASHQPVATGFWDRCARPTCGRLRRVLGRLHFADLPIPPGQVRKKASPTAHLPKGVAAHRRHKAVAEPLPGKRIAA